MKRAEAIRRVRAAAKAGEVTYLGYGKVAMEKRGIPADAVLALLARATSFKPQTQDHWRVFSAELTVIVWIRPEGVFVRNVF